MPQSTPSSPVLQPPLVPTSSLVGEATGTWADLHRLVLQKVDRVVS